MKLLVQYSKIVMKGEEAPQLILPQPSKDPGAIFPPSLSCRFISEQLLNLEEDVLNLSNHWAPSFPPPLQFPVSKGSRQPGSTRSISRQGQNNKPAFLKWEQKDGQPR